MKDLQIVEITPPEGESISVEDLGETLNEMQRILSECILPLRCMCFECLPRSYSKARLDNG